MEPYSNYSLEGDLPEELEPLVAMLLVEVRTLSRNLLEPENRTDGIDNWLNKPAIRRWLRERMEVFRQRFDAYETAWMLINKPSTP